jgi:hypothetical protein
MANPRTGHLVDCCEVLPGGLRRKMEMKKPTVDRVVVSYVVVVVLNGGRYCSSFLNKIARWV